MSTKELGKGFDESNLWNMRTFYRIFSIRDALRHELSWTHYRLIGNGNNQSFAKFSVRTWTRFFVCFF
ncbi:MAG: DUF1016 N-terminal domain-containing protein [Planctomycetaceae bacterium]|nr:DUF1016 N-terminal domain-containing protein [Planctomycetaceae bacterium]